MAHPRALITSNPPLLPLIASTLTRGRHGTVRLSYRFKEGAKRTAFRFRPDDQHQRLRLAGTFRILSGMAQNVKHHHHQQQQQQQQQGLQLYLYDDPHSEYCAKVKVVMHHKGLSWHTVPVTPCGASSPEFLAKAPLGKIPALVVVSNTSHPVTGLHEEYILYESEVINEWLEEQFPDPCMLPGDSLRRSQARLISRFHDLYLEPALRKLYPHVDPLSHNAGAVAAAVQEFHVCLGQLEVMLSENSKYAAADALTLADSGYPGLLLYAELLWPVLGLGRLEYAKYPKIRRWSDALRDNESVQKVLQELRPAAQEWVDRKLQQDKQWQPEDALEPQGSALQ